MTDRLIAIGDIHGDIVKLNTLLDKLNLSQKDTVVFLGDYIDVGNNSMEVIDKLILLSKKINCIFLKGNHEDLLLKCAKTKSEEDMVNWLMVGGLATYYNYGDINLIFNKHLDFFLKLQLYYETEKYLFVHGGIRPNIPLLEQSKEDILWIRDDFIYNTHGLKQKVIFGHTPFNVPYIENDKIGINTGCGIAEDGYLTAIICGEEEIFISSKQD